MSAWIGRSKPAPLALMYSPLECDACGDSIRILLPCSINALAMVARAFEDAHAECDQANAALET